MFGTSSAPDVRAAALARKALARLRSPFLEVPARVLVVDVDRQCVALLLEGRIVAEYGVSTSSNGVGGEAGSHRTPPGWHRVRQRIGEGVAVGTVFVSREPSGQVWHGETRDDDLILTRILTLEGLEDGVNRGPGCDSLERYIYLHGTNQEESIGHPRSHGCIRLGNADMVALFDRVLEGDPVLIAAAGDVPMPDPVSDERFHYAGVGGSGMSALAQYQAMLGGRASGSDRGFDLGERPEARAQLERTGVALRPQDGSGVEGDCAVLVVSTAVEPGVPDFAVAVRRELPLVHRSVILAHWVAGSRSIAVSGTSGKSTVTAMAFELLRGAGRDPSVITGGDLLLLQREGLWGNAWAGQGGVLLVEADESDGSLIRYEPAIGVALNLSRDHKTEAEVYEMFATLKRRTRETFVCGEDDSLGALREGALVFGCTDRAAVRARALELGGDGSRFAIDGVRFKLPVPGEHNVFNALGAIATCRALGVPLTELTGPLEHYLGVARRFQSLGLAHGVEVIDDFGHNPAKIAASLAAAHLRAARVLAVFQPHGYGPTRFLRQDLIDTFVTQLRPEDQLFMLEIFYAGGSAVRDLSSADLVREIVAGGRQAEFEPSRPALLEHIATRARPGDLVLVMGARDPSLTPFAASILARLETISEMA
ncbi:MAG: L,D-transpeptidase family protein [Candidatus Eisenbacteria bacterium]